MHFEGKLSIRIRGPVNAVDRDLRQSPGAGYIGYRARLLIQIPIEYSICE
jgi:hypothetical protein